MSTLSKALRKTLSDTTEAARTAAERACRAALENLAVHEAVFRPHMSKEQRVLRNRLRCRGRALGDFDERQLLGLAGAKADRLEDWLRDEFFEAHCKLFHSCPFIWRVM